MKTLLCSFGLAFALMSGVVAAQSNEDGWTPTERENQPGYSLQEALSDALRGEGTVPSEEQLNRTLPQHLAGVEANLTGEAQDVTLTLQKVANVITGIAAAIAVGFLVNNAFSLVLYSASSDSVTKAKQGIVWSLVGLVVIMVAYVIVKTVIFVTYSGEFEEVSQAPPSPAFIQTV